MSKVLFGCLVAGALFALAAAPGCKGSKKKGDGDGCAATACAGCACAAEGCGGGACGCEAGCACDACACGACACDACACGGCGLGACGCGPAAEVSDMDARHAMRLYRQYLTWNRANKDQFKSKAHKALVTNYVNNLGRDSWKGAKPYPVGAAIAKEGWKDDKRIMVWFMEKRAPGFDRENGDWWYATMNAQGKVMNAGAVASCVSCHVGAENDYVFGRVK